MQNENFKNDLKSSISCREKFKKIQDALNEIK
jgi:hypothetical protein